MESGIRSGFSRWVQAGLLTVVSDILLTLAQFMPMKSILILASNSVPGFFPRFLVDAGPTLAALGLVGIAGSFAILGSLARNVARASVQPLNPLPAHQKPTPLQYLTVSFGNLTLREFSGIVLLVVLTAASALVSLVYTMATISWVAASAVILAFAVHQGSRKPPYPNGLAEFDEKFRKWITRSALWSVVAAAIFTLVVSEPALGVTGILLAAVFLRRAQQVGPDLVPLAIKMLIGRSASRSVQVNETGAVQAPFDFIGTSLGQRLLHRSLQDLHVNDDSWEVHGVPDNTQLTIVCRNVNQDDTRVIRLFARGSTGARDHELDLRTRLADYLPSNPSALVEAEVAGLPAIILDLPARKPDEGTRFVIDGDPLNCQIAWELKCASSEQLQKNVTNARIEDPQESMLPLLTTASRIHGPHREAISHILDAFPQIREDYLAGPRVLSLGGPLTERNLLSVPDSGKEIIDVSRWEVAVLGAHWPRFGKLSDEAKEEISRHVGEEEVSRAQLRNLVTRVHEALKRRDTVLLHKDAKDLLLLLH